MNKNSKSKLIALIGILALIFTMPIIGGIPEGGINAYASNLTHAMDDRPVITADGGITYTVEPEGMGNFTRFKYNFTLPVYGSVDTLMYDEGNGFCPPMDTSVRSIYSNETTISFYCKMVVDGKITEIQTAFSAEKGCGYCGDNVIWGMEKQENGGFKLKIFGSGDMYDFGSFYPPWFWSVNNSLDLLQSVEIESGVTGIGGYAFYSCGLQDAIIAGTVTSVREMAFSGCKLLKSIIIPGKSIDYSDTAFQGCSGLEIAYISDESDYMLFLDCGASVIQFEKNTGSVKKCYQANNKIDLSIEIPSEIDGQTVYTINNNAFLNCGSIISITLPDSISGINDSAFKNCVLLKNINIPRDTEYVQSNAFDSCIALESIIIPDNVTEIGSGTFKDCTALKNVKLSNKLEYIDEDMFNGCTSLESITIPDSVTTLGCQAFANCTALKEITILDMNLNFGSIDENAFSDCHLEYAYITSNIDYTELLAAGARVIKFEPSTETVTSCYLPDGAEDVIIPSKIGGYTVTAIGTSAFKNKDALKRLVLPPTLTTLSDNSLADMDGLPSIIIPEATVNISSSAFNDAPSGFLLKFISDTAPQSVIDSGLAYITGYTPFGALVVYANIANNDEYAYYITDEDTNPIETAKWAYGEKTKEYFNSYGTVLSGLEVYGSTLYCNPLTNVITLYTKDCAGNTTISVVNAAALKSADIKITYGQDISDINTSGWAYAKGKSGKTVSGTWKIKSANGSTPITGSYPVNITFSPSDRYSGYSIKLKNFNITVEKKIPTVITYPTADRLIYGQTLANSVLSGGKCDVPGTWRWSDSANKPNAGTQNCIVNFIPDDLDNISGLSITVPVTIDKAVPNIGNPKASNITYGQTLNNSVITSN